MDYEDSRREGARPGLRDDPDRLADRARPRADPSYRDQALKSLRRLAFLGIEPLPAQAAEIPQPFHAAYASPVDGGGYRTLWLARCLDGDRVATLYLQLHDEGGVKGAWGVPATMIAEFTSEVAAAQGDERLHPIDTAYGLLLLKDALYATRQQNALPPPEFYLRSGMFTREEMTAACYIPPVAPTSEDMAVNPRLLAASARLLDDDFFGGWYMASGRVYDYAEQWLALEENESRGTAARVETLLEEFCDELVLPQVSRIARRLLLNADLMQRCGRGNGDRGSDPGGRLQSAELSPSPSCPPVPAALCHGEHAGGQGGAGGGV